VVVEKRDPLYRLSVGCWELELGAAVLRRERTVESGVRQNVPILMLRLIPVSGETTDRSRLWAISSGYEEFVEWVEAVIKFNAGNRVAPDVERRRLIAYVTTVSASLSQVRH
jgi:hypothetical protein